MRKYDEAEPENIGKIYEAALEKDARKSGGIYYTPPYIADYIVKNTVGKRVKGSTLKNVTKITIVDTACGAGIFLLGAYQFLLDWYKKYHKRELTFDERTLILKNNIYGIDIDPFAVALTRYALQRKCSDGFPSERILPNIDSNICVGNSLVDTDIYDSGDFGDERTIKPFHWQRAFPEVFRQGGFDAVIGNPPYEVTLGKDNKGKQSKVLATLNKYYKSRYRTIQGEVNLYKLFVEHNTMIANDSAYVGMIMPTSLLSDCSNAKLRQFIFSRFSYFDINQFPEKARVFRNVTQDVSIYVFSNTVKKIQMRSGLLTADDLQKTPLIVPMKLLTRIEKIPLLKNTGEIKVLQKLSTFPTFKEKEYVEFIEGEIHLTKFAAAICSDATKKSIVSMMRGDAVRRYFATTSSKDSYVDEKSVKAISLSSKFEDVGKERLIYQQIVNIQKQQRLNFLLITDKIYAANTCGYVLNKSNVYDIKYFLGLLNSSLLNWRYKLTSSNNHILTNELYALPCPALDVTDKASRQIHGDIVRSVEQLLQSYAAKEGVILSERKRIEDKIAHYENKINEIVYQLYGLTDEEIAIIENDEKV